MVVRDTRVSPGPHSDVWDAAPWLAELRDVPAGATWPRLMTAPHPRAVGTYGKEIERQFTARTGKVLRWWQRLAAARLLEHDDAGLLVWGEYLLTLSRQGGKSWLLRELALWRLQQGERWGDQLIVHTGRDKGIVLEIARPAMAWAETNGLHVIRNNGRECIATGAHETGSRWVLRAKDAVYGLAATSGLVDEGWDVESRYVDEGLMPTLVEQTSPQLGLVSTAHRRATGLMLDRRGLAIEQLDAPTDTLLLEWSAPADLDRGDPVGWRQASPHWSPAREGMIRKAYRKVLAGESVDPSEPDPVASFDAQWLNRWPGAPTAAEDQVEPLVSESAWASCRDDRAVPGPDRPLFGAIEDNLGRGCAAAIAGLSADGARVVVGGWEFADRAAAVDWLQDYLETAADPLLLVGATLVGDTELEGLEIPSEPVGGTETKVALPLLRELVRAGVIAYEGHDDRAADGVAGVETADSSDVTRQVLTARVRPGTASAAMLIVGHDRSDLLRCVAWVVQRAHRDRE